MPIFVHLNLGITKTVAVLTVMHLHIDPSTNKAKYVLYYAECLVFELLPKRTLAYNITQQGELILSPQGHGPVSYQVAVPFVATT